VVFNSQKENMMQALNLRNVEPALKPELISTVLDSVDGNKDIEIKKQSAADLKKKQSFNRFLEAYSDCV
jgi:hypothetical protein